MAALLLTGCSSSAPETAPTTAAAAPTTTASPTAAAPESIPTASGEADKTADFKTANVALFGPSHVAVMEDDGTNFVLFGHLSVPKGACTEV